MAMFDTIARGASTGCSVWKVIRATSSCRSTSSRVMAEGASSEIAACTTQTAAREAGEAALPRSRYTSTATDSCCA